MEEDIVLIIPMESYLEIDYTNWKGARSTREVYSLYPFFGVTEYHGDEEQLFIKCTDLKKDAVRDFAVKDIHSWRVMDEQ